MKKYNYIIPTYEECVEITSYSNNAVFYEIKGEFNGYKTSFFNYHISYQGLFNEPIPGSHLKGHELRGLLYIFNNDGTIFSRNLLLRKFFNINQEEETKLELIREAGISDVYEKADGSVITFNKFPDGKIFARSKCSFITEQATGAMEVYNSNTNIQKFVSYCLNNDIVPIFEYVSPNNRIVLRYDESDLILLRLRCNNTGDYLSLDDYTHLTSGITIIPKVSYTDIDVMIDESKTIKEKEGWVFSFNGKLAKLKTEWYFQYHGLYTESINRLNLLIQTILDNNIDDILPRLTDERKEEIEEVIYVINAYIQDIQTRTMDIVNSDFNGNVKEFVSKYKSHELFSFMMIEINHGNLFEQIENKIRKDTFFLKRAHNWYDKNSKIYLNKKD